MPSALRPCNSPSPHCRAHAGPPHLRVPYPHQTARRQTQTLANRTRHKLVRKGVVQCLEDWASQRTSEGLELMVSKGLFELTGESLVLKYANRFSSQAVASARSKLEDFGYSPP